MIEIRKQAEATTDWSKGEYELIYAGHGIRQTDSFYAWLLRLMRPGPGARLLDISCGEGSLGRLASAAGVHAYGLDLSEVALRVAARDEPRQRLVLGDAQQLPFARDAFDYVANIGSLEHYVAPDQGAREIARVLRPGGLACVLLPNIYSLLDNIWYAYRFGRTFEDYQPIQRYAARYDWQRLLEANGLHVERTVKYQREWPQTWTDVRHYLRRPKALVRLILTPLVPLNLASCFVYLCRKH
jgi:SAM-dependent methyltransferase